MLLRRTTNGVKKHFVEHITYTTIANPNPKTSTNWRTQIQHNQLLNQITTILLQRHNWSSLLNNLNLSSKLTPSLFLQILKNTQHSPQITLHFFNWTTTHFLHFKPDINSLCFIIQLSITTNQTQLAKPILDSLIKTHSSALITKSMIQTCKGSAFHSADGLSFVLEAYSRKGLILDGLVVYRLIRVSGFVASVSACNALLDVLSRGDQIRLGLCLCGGMLRDGVMLDKVYWSLLARMFCKNGKFEVVLRLLDSGTYSSVMYSLVVEWYSRIGDFEAAFARLEEMCVNRKLNVGFSTCSSILDGACRFNNAEVCEKIVDIMKKKGLLSNWLELDSEYDKIIQKLCDLGRSYAAEMVYNRACDGKIRLEDDTYGCMLTALLKEGRVKNAIEICRVVLDRRVVVKDSCYHALADALCRENHSNEASEILINIVKRGYSPSPMQLSKFVASQCGKGKWEEVEELLNAVLKQGVSLDSLCCSLLIEHYCSCGQIDKAVSLHSKIEKLNSSLDIETYNVMLDGFFKDNKIEEAVKVFDYMNRLGLVSSESFVIMISELCRVKELRKAMKLHDIMLKMGLKPDDTTYRELISGFS